MQIDINLIDNELLEVLSPLLIELAEVEEPLDFQEFSSAMNRLYDSLTPPHKDILLLKTGSKQTTKDKNCSFQVSAHRAEDNLYFQPQINENSR